MTMLLRRAYILTLLTSIVLCLTFVKHRLVSAAPVPFLNLDFEVAVQRLPSYWYVHGSGFDFSLDNAVAHSGQHSFRIQNVSASPHMLATAGQSFPIELVRGKHVRVKGWIKTSNVDGAAGIWWRVDGPTGTISLDNAPLPGLPPGSTDWRPYEFERDVSIDGNAVSWGVFFRGGGAARFDGLEIFIDGIPLHEGPAPFA